MGIKSAGLLLARMVTEEGYNFADYSEYPSLVRGGHNSYQITISNEEVLMVDKEADILISLSPGHEEDKHNLLDIPLSTMVAQMGGSIFANTISLGALCWILDLNKAKSLKLVEKQYGTESKNNEAFEKGYEWAESNSKKIKLDKKPSSQSFDEPRKFIADGNEAISWGLVKGGCDFFAAYPMTPVTGILHFLAKNQDELGVKVFHPEDEIAVASMATGASIAGARAAVATSGGGFALMTETISLNGMLGTGVVYVLGQRPGPATGMPTWTGQGELLFATFAGHGEFPKVVLAPGDIDECFEVSRKARNVANKYDIPVIVLADKMLCEGATNTIDLKNEKKIVVKSKKIVPGSGIYLYNSYEHDAEGFSTEDSKVAKKEVDKRVAKGGKIVEEAEDVVNFYGSKSATKLIVSWGSTKGAILEALRGREDFAFLQVKMLWPINKAIGKIINSFKNKILIENNATAQLGRLLKSEMSIEFDKTILKYDGRPFFAEEIKNKLKIQNPSPLRKLGASPLEEREKKL
jgi:2-oxoglutarate/2-oxoacid ferredoxin oxidoreductase subunit alpha